MYLSTPLPRCHYGHNDPLLLGVAVRMGASIENYRPFKSASVVDMNEDNSEGLAWGLSATHAAKSTAVEMLLDDEEAEAEEVPLFSLLVDLVAASFFLFV